MNPYFRLCLLAAALAPTTDELRSVPVCGAQTGDVETGQLRVEVSVRRAMGRALFFEVNARRTQSGADIIACNFCQVVQQDEFESADFKTLVHHAFAYLRETMWRGVFGLSDQFRNFGGAQDWVGSLRLQLKECEKTLVAACPARPFEVLLLEDARQLDVRYIGFSISGTIGGKIAGVETEGQAFAEAFREAAHETPVRPKPRDGCI